MSNENKVIDLARLQYFKSKLQDFGQESEPFYYMWRDRTPASVLQEIYHRTELHIGRPIVWMNEGTPALVDAKFTSSNVITFTCVTQGKYCAWNIDSNGNCNSIAEYLPLPAVIDDLATTDVTKALSAAQGKILADMIANAQMQAQSLMFDLLPKQGSGNPVTSGGLYTMKQDLQGQINNINAALEDNVLTMEVDETGAIKVTTGENSGLDALQSGIDPVTGLIKLVYNVA